MNLSGETTLCVQLSALYLFQVLKLFCEGKYSKSYCFFQFQRQTCNAIKSFSSTLIRTQVLYSAKKVCTIRLAFRQRYFALHFINLMHSFPQFRIVCFIEIEVKSATVLSTLPNLY